MNITNAPRYKQNEREHFTMINIKTRTSYDVKREMPPPIDILQIQHPRHTIDHVQRPNQIRMHSNDNANNSRIILASIHHIHKMKIKQGQSRSIPNKTKTKHKNFNNKLNIQ